MYAVSFGIAGAISVAATLGLFEGLEIGVLDQFSKVRSSGKVTDERILVVTINEEDITNVGQWPIHDAALADVVSLISVHTPASIGIDLYRNLPVEPGTENLVKVFENTPNVIGIERVIGEVVPAHPTLLSLGKTGSSDLVLDSDGNIRRGLLSVITPKGEVKQTLAATLALDYLYGLGIGPEPLDDSGLILQLGKGKVARFERNDGGYVNADTGGFQVLMNYRQSYEHFDSIPMSAVLAGELTDERVQGRIVLIGAIAVSTNDWFATPLGGDQVAGVYIHAQLVSQLLDVALEGKPLLKAVPLYAELLWTAGWVAVSILTSYSILFTRSLKSGVPMWQLGARLLGTGSGLVAVSYGLFLAGWWMPVALPMVSMAMAIGLGVTCRNQQLQNLAAFDELTQVANRRYFDQYLAESLKTHKQLALILFDVDYFKVFNDLYGHPAGDRCLQQVATALRLGVRNSDMVARYGGEEFVVVLPTTDEETAAIVAMRVQEQIHEMAITHEGSEVNEWVTISCGVASVSPNFGLPASRLIEYADQALYKAKQSGRNRVVMSQWQKHENDEAFPSEKV